MIPEGDFRFIALDVETASSDAGSICQIGLACVASDNSIHSFSTLVNPGTRFDAFNTQLHGIGPEHVAGAPRFGEALGDLFPLLSRHHLVQHSSFDKRAVAASCQSCGLEAPNFRWSDSVQIARRAWPELKGNGGHGLGNLKKVLRLDFHHHDAGEERLQDSTFRNEDLTQITWDTFDEIISPDLEEFVQDGLVTSALISGALQARAMLGGQAIPPAQMRSHLELAGIGAGTAVTVDALISML